MAVTKDVRVIGHLKKGKMMNKACKFPAQFHSREKKNILKFKKKVELVPIIIVCTLEILSEKYEEYQYYH